MVYVRGGHTIPDTVPSQRSTPRTRGSAGLCGTRFMVQCDLLCPFPRALCDFPYSVHLKRGVLTHRIEVPSVPDKSRFLKKSWTLPRAGGICVVGAGPSCLLPSTMPLGCFLARGALSRYLPTRRVRSGHSSAVRWASRLPL